MADYITGLNYIELETLMKQWDIPSYRVKQLLQWVYKHNIMSYDDITNMPQDILGRLRESFAVCSLDMADKLESKKERAAKYIFKTNDGKITEGVSIHENGRHTLCVSSQIGCPFKCRFCASGKNGLKRNLKTAEIVDQIRIMSKDEKMTNIVFMGSGEPLLNFDNFSKAYEIITADWGLALGQRKITVSTAGFVPGIEKLIESNMRPKLALSLHAPSNEKRNRIMAINRKYPIENVLYTSRKYADQTGRMITVEYILIRDFNDTRDDAKMLSKLFKDYPAKINLIPYNPVEGLDYSAPKPHETISFEQMLKSFGLNVTIRFSKGSSIMAACGQLGIMNTQ